MKYYRVLTLCALMLCAVLGACGGGGGGMFNLSPKTKPAGDPISQARGLALLPG